MASFCIYQQMILLVNRRLNGTAVGKRISIIRMTLIGTFQGEKA